MPQNKQGLNIFVASSSDVAEERRALDRVVGRLDNTFNEWALDLQVIDWKKSVVPDFGEDPQGVINRQIRFEHIDIFIGIVWRRIGIPTPRALSGTVEEVNRALQCHQQSGRPWLISFFLCDRSFKPSSKDEAYQKQEADKFKAWIDSHALTSHYTHLREFEDQALDSLSKALHRFVQNQMWRQLPALPQPQPLRTWWVNQLTGVLGVACPWCGFAVNMPLAVYQSNRGTVWRCPRCLMPHFYA
jgi:hypothetical protein